MQHLLVLLENHLVGLLFRVSLGSEVLWLLDGTAQGLGLGQALDGQGRDVRGGRVDCRFIVQLLGRFGLERTGLLFMSVLRRGYA